ncbi:hypothetical protein [Bacteroides caecimuris]|nr:hypothetical protein [Bacteroides caecimuris]
MRRLRAVKVTNCGDCEGREGVKGVKGRLFFICSPETPVKQMVTTG